MKREPGLFLYLFLPAVTMSLGWGLRGTIGGGPMGATIPGAMVALALCLLLGRQQQLCGLIVAFGAIGFGIGGEMTYGQTIGFARAAETVLWGLTGMTVKGAVWGLAGGVILGIGFIRRRFSIEEIGTGLLYMVVGTVAGWGILNRPKLIYFSDRLKEPREEVWAAIAAGAVCLLVYLYARGKGKIPGAFAFWGMIFGGIGFGGGGLFIRLSAAVPKAEQIYPSWKAMEFFFGLMLGLGLGIAAYLHRKELQDDEPQIPSPPATDSCRPVCSKYLTAVLVVFGALWLHFHVGFAATFSVMGALWLMVSLYSEPLAWQLGVSFTVLGFVRDMFYGIYRAFQPFLVTQPSDVSARIWPTALLESLPSWMWLLTFIAALPIVAVVHRDSVARQRNLNDHARLLDLKQTLLALSWLGVAAALLKIMVIPILTSPDGFALGGMSEFFPLRKMQVQITFILLGVLMTAALVPIKARCSSEGSSAG